MKIQKQIKIQVQQIYENEINKYMREQKTNNK